jgi:hypothetical protein
MDVQNMYIENLILPIRSQAYCGEHQRSAMNCNGLFLEKSVAIISGKA